MKHLKLFNNENEYNSFVESEDFVLPNVSYWKDGEVKFNPFVAPANPNIVCVYNITDISGETKIAGNYAGNYFTSMIVNGVEMELDTYYQFDTIGKHIVEFVLDDSTTSIGDVLNSCSALTSVTIPNSVTSLGGTFRGCTNLTSVTIPNSVTSIGSNTFNGCSALTSIVIPDGVTNIGSNTFYGCSSLTSIVIPDGVTAIGSRAFYGCKGLTSIVIPDSVTTIDNYAFYNCTGLTKINIGSGVTSIGGGVFYDCSSLSEITCNAITAPTISDSTGGNTFYGIKEGGVLKVPAGSDYSVWMTTSYYLYEYNWTIEYI